MPADSKTTVSPPKSKPTTRSSIRQSLNLASVSKAFVDVISKDGREASKNAKKTRDASRRSSTLSSLPPAASRASMGDVKPPSQVSKRTGTPDSKTVTRRRVSASYARSSSDEQSSKQTEPSTPQSALQPKTTTLRPRNLNATSALPKYRPKSAVIEAAKPPSPVRAGTRRRLSTSDDEKKEQNGPAPSLSPAEKTSRPISPLPHRAALKANLTNSVNATPPSSPSKPKIATPSSSKTSPSRPTKIVKTTASTTLPRPPSSSSSATSLRPTPNISTPKTSGIKAKLGLSRSGQGTTGKSGGSPPKASPSPFTRDSPSPLARHSRQNSRFTTPASSVMSGNMSHISEGNSEPDDSDAEDVELLLAPVAALGAPTPAMPRIQNNRKRLVPQTPTRTGLPSRENLSYLSPLPPDSAQKSVSMLRPPQRQTGNNNAIRGSILSWEQLATEASRTLGEDEFGRMLADIPAPFRSGAASPSLSSQMDVPESPCLSAIDSPGGYGSISQVLLPDVTPSPAMHYSIQQSRFSLSPDSSVVDSSTVTLLRLQLASAENTAKERLFQMQAMEEELHNLKQAHVLQMEEAQKQMQYMEYQGRANDERASYAASLEEQLCQAQLLRDQAVEEALARFQESANMSQRLALNAECCRYEAASSASLAASKWDTVVSACEVELDFVRSDKAVLSLLLEQIHELSQAC